MYNVHQFTRTTYLRDHHRREELVSRAAYAELVLLLLRQAADAPAAAEPPEAVRVAAGHRSQGLAAVLRACARRCDYGTPQESNLR